MISARSGHLQRAKCTEVALDSQLDFQTPVHSSCFPLRDQQHLSQKYYLKTQLLLDSHWQLVKDIMLDVNTSVEETSVFETVFCLEANG